MEDGTGRRDFGLATREYVDKAIRNALEAEANSVFVLHREPIRKVTIDFTKNRGEK
jgi:isocitrate dehydrogenase